MAIDKQQNIQDVFLNTLRKKKVPVTVFLSSGVKLQGNITGFDNFCITLRRGPQMQLVYKHSIATVVPAGPVSFYEGDESEAGAVDEVLDASFSMGD
jgi:host factor-I protein